MCDLYCKSHEKMSKRSQGARTECPGSRLDVLSHDLQYKAHNNTSNPSLDENSMTESKACTMTGSSNIFLANDITILFHSTAIAAKWFLQLTPKVMRMLPDWEQLPSSLAECKLPLKTVVTVIIIHHYSPTPRWIIIIVLVYTTQVE